MNNNKYIDLKIVEWTKIEGQVTEYKINDQIWIPKLKLKKNKPTVYMTRKKHKQGTKLERWIKTIKVGEDFTLDEYYKDNPKDRPNNARNERYLSKMVEDKTIQQDTKYGVDKIRRLK